MTRCYDPTMSSENDKVLNFIANTVESLRQRIDTMSEQMATKVDLANLREATKDDLAALEFRLREEMATKEDLNGLESRLRVEMATKNDLNRLETTMLGEFEQVHLRFDAMDRRVDTRMGQIESDVSRLRSRGLSFGQRQARHAATSRPTNSR